MTNKPLPHFNKKQLAELGHKLFETFGPDEFPPLDETEKYKNLGPTEWENKQMEYSLYGKPTNDLELQVLVTDYILAEKPDICKNNDLVIFADDNSDAEEKIMMGYFIDKMAEKAKNEGRAFVVAEEGISKNPRTEKIIDILNTKTDEQIYQDFISSASKKVPEEELWEKLLEEYYKFFEKGHSSEIKDAVINDFKNKNHREPTDKEFGAIYKLSLESSTIETISNPESKQSVIATATRFLMKTAVSPDFAESGIAKILYARSQGAKIEAMPSFLGTPELREKYGLPPEMLYNFDREKNSFLKTPIDLKIYNEEHRIQAVGKDIKLTMDEFIFQYQSKMNQYWADILVGNDGKGGIMKQYESTDGKPPLVIATMGVGHLYTEASGKIRGVDELLEDKCVTNFCSVSASYNTYVKKNSFGRGGFSTNYQVFLPMPEKVTPQKQK